MITFIKLPTGARARYVSDFNGKSPAILIVHGWKSNNPFGDGGMYAKIQAMLLELGYNSLLVALRGHQPSIGNIQTVTRKQHLIDLGSAIRWMRKRSEIDPRAIGAYGSSYGAYMLAVLAAKANFALLAQHVPALYPDKGWTKPTVMATDWNNLIGWRESVHTKDGNMALSGIACVRGPVAIFTAEDDEYMPPAVGASYKKASAASRPADLCALKGGHVLNRQKSEELLRLLALWFKTNKPRLH